MSRLARWSLMAASLAAALGAAALVGVSWKGRADDICRKEALSRASGFTVEWQWDEFAYVCDYEAPTKPQRRVSIINAFHGDGRKRHGG
ncbi:MAG TPA: hypothetical protein VFS23_13455 [Vicinamibacterales bacterium]|nr:hypothetical protein [Vicinamibacterales bacterium]